MTQQEPPTERRSRVSGALQPRRCRIAILPGIDDYPGKTEITYLSDTRRILGFARARAHGLGLLSAWAIQRDNGGCPGTIDSNSCSGIKQPAWAFSHLLERFTR